jgi:hypothetical protein
MSHSHELVQSCSAQYGVEREADLHNIEEDSLCAEVFSAPNVTEREMQPHGVTDTGPTLENGRDGWSFPIGIYSFLKAARRMRLRATPPSIKTWYNLTLEMVGETRSGS